MLNGVAPILIFNFPENPASLSPVFNALSGIPLVGPLLPLSIGVPIPLYLDERVTGLYVDTQGKNLDIETTIEPRYDNKKPFVYQRALNSSITINLNANKDSILLPALLALTDFIIPRLISQNYQVSYLNGPTVILGGLLQGLNTNEGSDDDLIRIVLQIQKTDQRPASPVPPTLIPVVGATPLGG